MGDARSAPSPPPLDVALYGKDPAARIVSVHPLLGGTEPALVRVYRRTADGTRVEADDEPFYPFFFLSDARLLQGLPRDRFRFQQLAGDNFYRYLVVFTTWAAYWEGVRHVERRAERTARSGRARDETPKENGAPPEGAAQPLYLVGSPAQQYLMQTGRTSFKEMAFDDLHRLQLDIEVYSESGFPQAERAGDEVIIVSMTDNRGWQLLLHTAGGVDVPAGEAVGDEAALLRRLVEVIREQDPDVLEGHNALAFDFPYLMARCDRHGVPFAIGRDGSVPRAYPSSMRFAERTVEFPALDIAGRHVIDTYLLVLAFDVFKRDMRGYGLKAAARYFGFAPEGRTYVEGDAIARVWREDPRRLLAYALDDAVETERLARHLSGSTFYLTQMLPMLYGQASRTGPAAKIEALFVREYLRQRHSLPKSEWGSQTVGGYTDVFFTGVAGPIVYADVESLYPSIMLSYDVKPKSDPLHLFQTLLRRLTDLRIQAKRGMKSAPTEEHRSELDARQSSYKVLINAFYGSLSFSLALFNDFAEADRVAATGQEILRKIIAAIRREGGRVIEVDTDGVLFVPPPAVRGEEAEQAFVKQLGSEMPAGIRIGFDGRFRAMLSYKKKNYALLRYDGKLRFKGSSLVSRSSERFGRQFVRDAVKLLLDEDIQGLHDLYLATREAVLRHDWPQGAEAFERTETIKETVEQYLDDVQAGRRTRAASYELAIARAMATGRPVRKGDRISYYITGTSPGVTAFEHCRFADEWSAERPDENTAYYLKRLDEVARKFEPFFTEHDFRLIFSPEDLFGFSPRGIRLQSTERSLQDVETQVPF